MGDICRLLPPEGALGVEAALKSMAQTFNEEYPARGMTFAMGTHSLYPKVWLLVGVLRLDPVRQPSLAL